MAALSNEINDLKYNRKITNDVLSGKCPSDCRVKLNYKSKEEGGGNGFKDNVYVVDLDCVEEYYAKTERREQKKTVDLVFGITDKKKTDKLLFVEYKLRVKNVTRNEKLMNIVKEMKEKVRNSKYLLKNERYRICDISFLVFNNENVNRARRWNNNKPIYEHFYLIAEKDLKEKIEW